jgi:hypothetical protein
VVLFAPFSAAHNAPSKATVILTLSFAKGKRKDLHLLLGTSTWRYFGVGDHPTEMS